MPLLPDDFIFSSSPPGFELNLDIRHELHLKTIDSHREQTFSGHSNRGWQAVETISISDTEDVFSGAPFLRSVQSEQNLQRIRKWQEIYDDCECDVAPDCKQDEVSPSSDGGENLELLSVADAPSPSTGARSPRTPPVPIMSGGSKSPLSPGGLKSKSSGAVRRSVSFADNLESVFVMEEMSSEPPSRLLQRLDIADKCGEDEVSLRPGESALVLNFPQPASDYMAFRNSVMNNCVSLENVIVKKHNVSGTVRVRNISYSKTVLIRYTLDSWSTHTDTSAVFQPSAVPDERFDVFAFSIDCPSELPVGTKLHFAVCYTVDGSTQYWDSNNGENYQVSYVAASPDSPSGFGPALFSLQPPAECNWCWSGLVNNDPYNPYW